MSPWSAAVACHVCLWGHWGESSGAHVCCRRCSVHASSHRTSDGEAVFDIIHEDIISRGLEKKAVVSVAWGEDPDPAGVVPRRVLDSIDAQRRIMLDLDVPIVYAAGNNAHISGRTDIDTYPQRFANDADLPLINVGNVDTSGSFSPTSQRGPALTVSAVGMGITCADSTGTGSHLASGTSFCEWLVPSVIQKMSRLIKMLVAAPQVAGLLAYFLSLNTVPFDTGTGSLAQNVKNFLRNTASRSRVQGGPNVA